MLILEMSFANIVSVLSLYVVSAFRVLPSMNRIFVNFNTLSFNVASLDVVSELLNIIKQHKLKNGVQPAKSESPEWDRISLENVEFSYTEGSKMLMLTNLNFDIGSSYVLSGPSGSGKTSILDLILKIRMPTSGTVCYKNFDREVDVDTVGNRQFSYVPQVATFLNGTILENITLEDFYTDDVDWNKLDEVTEVCGVTAMLTRQHADLNSRVGEGGEAFSGGQRQLISLARALYRSPKLLILDEATSAMDMKLEEEILRRVMNYCTNCCIISVTHNPEITKLFSKHYKLIGGELFLSTRGA
jgi:ATP-binding cassette subfamily B protein